MTFQANDDEVNNNLSNLATRNIIVASANDNPILAAIKGGAPAYTENAAATAITATITASEVDNANLAGATIQITVGYVNSEDVLSFTNQLGITGVFTPASGLMTLSGTTTLANYQIALRAINNPSTATRTVAFQVNEPERPGHTEFHESVGRPAHVDVCVFDR